MVSELQVSPGIPQVRGEIVLGAGILVLAFVLRVVLLGMKPPHFDEGVNGWFVDEITRQGYYHYDPGLFHGPLHFYVLFIAQTLLGRAVWVLRLPLVLVSTACVGVTLAFRRFIDWRACAIAALAMAVSPGMVFYGRYAIHESWLLLFLLVTAWGILGLWRFGTRMYLWALVLGVTGMILIKETYAIHVIALALAFPTLLVLERLSRSKEMAFAKQQWVWADLCKAVALGIALIVFFYTGGLMDWPDFSRKPGTIGSLAGLWETFTLWRETGTSGHTGHEKPWPYWLDLLSRYEWVAAAGMVSTALILRPRENRCIRYLAIAGLGTLMAYSIIDYKTPWCVIVMMWPFLFVFGHYVVRAFDSIDRWSAGAVAIAFLAASLAGALRLNFWKYTDETEPYVYVQTLPDINKLMKPLEILTRISPEYYHLRGHVVLQESDSHPLPWLLADFTRVDFLENEKPPEDVDADFLVVEDAYVAAVEERLTVPYFKDEFELRGGWGTSATLFLKAGTFGPLYPGRTAEFTPGAPVLSEPVPEETPPSNGESAAFPQPQP